MCVTGGQLSSKSVEVIQVYDISTNMYVSVVISLLCIQCLTAHIGFCQIFFAFNSHENCLAVRLLLGVTEDHIQ